MPRPIVSTIAAALIAAISISPAMAQREGFTTGPVFTDFGPVADVDADSALSSDSEFRVAFDVSEAATPGQLNRTLESAARFINMQVRAGVAPENVHVAVVVHGKASFDITGSEKYAAQYDGAENANLPLIAALLANNVRIIECGQSAAAYKIARADLAPGVEMALSAMTAHAQLQQAGYTLNPF